jgi:uncharacterized protein YjdB
MVVLFVRCSTNGAQVVLQTISFKPDTVKMWSGNSVQLQPVFKPSVFSGIAVNWSLTDESVASVSPTGLLYAIQPGQVTVTIKDKNSATAGKCVVIVQ